MAWWDAHFHNFHWGWILFFMVMMMFCFFGCRRFFSGQCRSDRSSPPDSLKVLDQRYARGEINKDEYLDMANTIKKIHGQRPQSKAE